MNIIVVIIKPSLYFFMISLNKYSYFISSSVKHSTSLYHASYHYPFIIFQQNYK